MKKLYLFLIAAITLSSVHAQTLLSEGFETGSSFPPNNWTRINAGSGNNWERNDLGTFGDGPYPFANTGTKSMLVEYNLTSAADAWMISPSLAMTAGTTYSISFWYRVRSATWPEKLKVTLGNAATVAAQTNTIWNNAGGVSLVNTNFLQATITYTPTTTGNLFLGFHCYNALDSGWAIIVDDVLVQQAAASVPNCTSNIAPANAATNVTYLPSVNLSWNAAATATSYDVYHGTANPPSLLGTTPNTNVNINGIQPSTTYYWYIVPKNSAGPATGCSSSIFSYTSSAAPAAPANDDCASATNISAYSGAVNGTTISATQSIAAEVCASFTGNANDDVWYKFTALQNGGATIALTPTGSFDAVMIGYSGNCGALVNIACADATGNGGAETLTFTNLTAGQTYYFRVYGYGGAGTESAFSLSASGAALPVGFAGFKAELQNGVSLLTWNTASEINNAGFGIERSADGVNFSNIGFVTSKVDGGTSNATQQYQFTDNRILSGNNFYRLKQTDRDGKFTYSNVVVVKALRSQQLEIGAIYPNPVKNQLTVMVNSMSNQKGTLTITDLSGKILKQQITALNNGSNTIALDVQHLSTGNYVIKIVDANGATAITKFVKQ
jgi:hypothetical protein